MKTVVQSLHTTLLERVGVISIARLLTRDTPRILMYHRFAEGQERRRLSLEVFDEQLRYIKQKLTPMSVTCMVRHLRRGTLPSNSVAVTIDDCYEDFYEYAWPLLKESGIPATIYPVTDFVSRKSWLWPDTIRYALRQCRFSEKVVNFGQSKFSLLLTNESSREAAWELLADYCLLLSNRDRLRFMEVLMGALEVEVPREPIREFSSMTWAQLREVAGSGLEVGAHSMTHPRLTSLSLLEAEREILESKLVIERELGSPVTSFCYPNGTIADCSASLKLIVQRCGYENAVLAIDRTPNAGDVYALGRIGRVGSVSDFKRSVSGLSWLVRRFKSLARNGAA